MWNWNVSPFLYILLSYEDYKTEVYFEAKMLLQIWTFIQQIFHMKPNYNLLHSLMNFELSIQLFSVKLVELTAYGSLCA